MGQSPGFVAQGDSGMVCRIKKAINGLKYLPMFDKLSNVLFSFKFTHYEYDHSVFVKQTSTRTIILVVYVDNIILSGSDLQGIEEVKVRLKQQFQTKDLDQLICFLGIEVPRGKKGLVLSQRKYVQDLLSEARMLGSRTKDTPMDPNVNFGDEESPDFEDKKRYKTFVGELNYLTITRLDLTFLLE